MYFLKRQQGFTILDMIVAFLILTILTVLMWPSSKYVRERAMMAIVNSDVHDMKVAAGLFAQDCGYYPPDVGRGVDPGLIEPNGWQKGSHSPLWDELECPDWGGPYLKTWKKNPWGGYYEWDNFPADYSALGIPAGGVYLTMKPSDWGGRDGLPPEDFESTLESQGIDVSKTKGVIAIWMGKNQMPGVPTPPPAGK